MPPMPVIPTCNSEQLYDIKFGTSGKLYTLDSSNAKKLSANIRIMSGCIDEFVLYSKEVDNAAHSVK